MLDRGELERVCRELHSCGKKIVTTNGVFDLLHVGHIRCLQFCKSQGDVLIVGVNADSSVKQYKGDARPIVLEAERAELIASLSCVDYVHIFSERTPEAWLEVVKPSVHVKAGDYTLDRDKETPKNKVWERDVVEKHGGRCVIAPLTAGKSTTGIIEKIAEVYGNVECFMPRSLVPRSPAVFLDRDGTIIQDKGYMHKIEELEFIPGAIEALQRLSASRFKIIVITNQSGLAREKFSETEYGRFHEHFLANLKSNGILVDGVYMCPHHPEGSHATFGKKCSCRKPKPGMILKAMQDHGIMLDKSVVVGDKSMDILMGNYLGISSVLVQTGNAGRDLEFQAHPDHTCPSLKEAVEWILNINH